MPSDDLLFDPDIGLDWDGVEYGAAPDDSAPAPDPTFGDLFDVSDIWSTVSDAYDDLEFDWSFDWGSTGGDAINGGINGTAIAAGSGGSVTGTFMRSQIGMAALATAAFLMVWNMTAARR